MKFSWGLYPTFILYIGLEIGAISMIAVGNNISAKFGILCGILVFVCLYFLHFKIETENYIIFCYSLIFLIIKKDGGVIVKANLGRPICDNYAYYIGDHTVKYFFVYKEEVREERKRKRKLEKDKFDYNGFINKIAKEGIRAKIVSEKRFSKIGGRPKLPSDFVWPVYTNDEELYIEIGKRPLSFLMQIDMRDVSKFDKSGLLPKTGVLSIFYDYLSRPMGENDYQQNGLKVFYFDKNIDELEDCTFDYPISEWKDKGVWLINERFIDFYDTMKQIPSNEEAEMIAGRELLKYYDLPEIANSYYGENDPEYCTQMLGYSYDIQGASLRDAVKDDDFKNYVLLMMIDSTRNLDNLQDIKDDDFCLGAVGIIYIYIKKEDLVNKNFNNIRYCVQND